MKFCDERIQRHLLNGGKIKRKSCNFLMFLNNNGFLCYQSDGPVHTCCINSKDLTADDWEIAEPEYDWDKIIKDKILCVFSDYEDYRTYVISPLIKVEDNNFSFKTIDELSYGHCKPFNPAEYNVAKNIKDYEE